MLFVVGVILYRVVSVVVNLFVWLVVVSLCVWMVGVCSSILERWCSVCLILLFLLL